MQFNEFLRTNAILGMICENFDFDKDMMLINQALLYENASPIEIVAKIDLKDPKIKDKSDDTVEDIFSTLDIDSLIDRLEVEEEDEERNAERLSVKLDTDEPKLKLSISDMNDSDKKDSDNTIKLNVKDQEELSLRIKNSPEEKINVKVAESDPMKTPVKVTIKDSSNTLNVNIKDAKESDTIKVNVDDKKSDGDINLKLKPDTDEKGNLTGDINIKLKNISKEPEDKVSSFINKRDELIATDNPNLQLTTCLKIIINLKKALERLVNYIPEEETLTQTKSLVGALLDKLMDSSNCTIILKDKNRMKDIIYKIFDMLMSINNYIEHKYIEIEDRLDDTTKKQETHDIDKSVHNVEVINAFREVAKALGSKVADDAEEFLKQDSLQSQQPQEGNVKPTPNINRKRI